MSTFNKKEWKNRVSEYPVRRRLTMIQDEGNQFVADVSREEGTVTQAGDAFSAGNMNDLENRIEQAFENTGGGNFVGVLYHASLVDFPGVPCWEDMSDQEKAKYDASTGATVNFLDEDLPSNIIGNTDISYIGDGTLTGGLAAHEDDIDELNSALITHQAVIFNNLIRFAERNKAVHVFANLTSLDSTKTVIEVQASAPYLPVLSYAILPLYSTTAPYTQIGTIWIYNNGTVKMYKPANVTTGYVSGCYVCQ